MINNLLSKLYSPRQFFVFVALFMTLSPIIEKFGFLDWHPWVSFVVFGAVYNYIADGINWK